MKWFDIPGFEGKYQISDTYLVKSLDRLTSDKRGNGSYTLKGRPIKVIMSSYPKITLVDGVIKKQILFHRLVATMFVPNPMNFPQVNHKNGDRNDYRKENLEWVNARENITHGYSDKKLSRYPGVSMNRGRWMATIYLKGKLKNLGRYDSELEAAGVYKSAIIENDIVNKYAFV